MPVEDGKVVVLLDRAIEPDVSDDVVSDTDCEVSEMAPLSAVVVSVQLTLVELRSEVEAMLGVLEVTAETSVAVGETVTDDDGLAKRLEVVEGARVSVEL